MYFVLIIIKNLKTGSVYIEEGFSQDTIRHARCFKRVLEEKCHEDDKKLPDYLRKTCVVRKIKVDTL